MTLTASGAPAAAGPELPHWETVPDDLPAAVHQVKDALRARIEASGRTVHEVLGVMEARVRARVAEIAANNASGTTAWPVIDYADIKAGTVTPGEIAALRRRGCLVVRGHFSRDQALGWDQEIVGYAERNRFFEAYRGPADDFFGSVGSRPEIYPIYWSPPQMQARQSAGWPGSSRSSTPSGPASLAACGGSTPPGTRSTPTASAAAPRARTPPDSAPTWIPAPSTCG